MQRENVSLSTDNIIIRYTNPRPNKRNVKFKQLHYKIIVRDSSVGIATAYRLDGPWIESRWGARFSAPVQTGPEAHPASCTMGTGSFQGVSCGRGVTLTTSLPSSAEV